SFFDGCSTGMSARPYATLDDGSGNLVLVQNSLFRLQDMDQGYQVPGHGGFFKWAEVGPQVALYNNVYRADSPSDLGGHTLGPPQGKLRDCANNVMIWLGAGPFPETLPGCFTLLTGPAGLAYWNAAVATWYANHPNALTDIAPPIVSLFAPAGGATVSAVTSLTATAVDDRDVAGVQFRLDGAAIGPEVTAESPLTKFTLSWDSRGTPDGLHALTATARDGAGNVKTSAPTTITIANGTPVPLSTVAVSPPTILASTGASAATVTVTVKDANDQPVSGATVVIAATGPGNTITQPAAPTGPDGVAIGTLTSTAAGPKTLTVTVNGLALSQQPVVTVVAGPPDANRSAVSAAPSAIVAGGGAATIVVTVRDAFGNPVGGATVGLSASGTGNVLTQPAGPTDASGVAGGSLSSSAVQTVTVTAAANGVTIAQTALVTVTSPAPPARITHTLLTSGHDPNNVRVFTTAAIAPAPGALVTVAVMTHQSSAAAPSPTLTGGGMPAWDVVGTITFDGTTPLKRVTIYRALAAAPGSGPITITSSVTVSNCQWIVSQWTGVDASGVNGAGAIAQTAAAGGTAVNGLSALLAPFANANDVAYGVFGVNANVVGTVTPGSGFAKIDEQPSGESTSADLFAEWAFNLNVFNATWTAKNGGALGIEIRVSPGP
ncbi:MAG TPA: Ig-like domain-containing protein, partial [Gemmatimonadales bacterium]